MDFEDGDTEPLDNLSAVLYKALDLRMEQRIVPELENNQVVIRMESIGICGSDVGMYSDGGFGIWSVDKERTLGHEGTGTVIRTGKDVKKLNLGDRVVIEPIISCRLCKFCKEGRYNLCPDLLSCSIPPTQGMISRFFVHDEDFCHKLPDNVDFDDGVLVEPLAVAIHSCKRANMTCGDVVVIFGAGAMGLTTALAAKCFGATKILIIDFLEYRLDMAKQLGVTFTLQIQEDTPHESIVNKITDILEEMPSVCLDCVGSENCVKIALEVTRSGGTVVVVGFSQFEMTLPLTKVICREVDLKGVYGINNDFPTAIELIRSARVYVKPLITHHFQIEDTVLAFKTAKAREGDPIKIIIHPNEDWIISCSQNSQKT